MLQKKHFFPFLNLSVHEKMTRKPTVTDVKGIIADLNVIWANTNAIY